MLRRLVQRSHCMAIYYKYTSQPPLVICLLEGLMQRIKHGPPIDRWRLESIWSTASRPGSAMELTMTGRIAIPIDKERPNRASKKHLFSPSDISDPLPEHRSRVNCLIPMPWSRWQLSPDHRSPLTFCQNNLDKVCCLGANRSALFRPSRRRNQRG